jgi:hypothetical protein
VEIIMADNEKTSDRLSTLASKAMRDPGSLTKAEIASLGATALTQSNDRAKAKAIPKTKPVAAKPAPKPAPKTSPPKSKR